MIKKGPSPYPLPPAMQSRALRIDVARQLLEVREGDAVLRRFPVSTAANGLGTEPGSLRTPTGRFRIAEKIGHGAPSGMVFEGRKPTGVIGDASHPGDLVQTRILWLDGLEPENANTKERYIYIHGTNHEARLGEPRSHGCVRMSNADVAELFDLVAEETPVFIQP